MATRFCDVTAQTEMHPVQHRSRETESSREGDEHCQRLRTISRYHLPWIGARGKSHFGESVYGDLPLGFLRRQLFREHLVKIVQKSLDAPEGVFLLPLPVPQEILQPAGHAQNGVATPLLRPLDRFREGRHLSDRRANRGK